MAVLEFPVLTY